jgi:ATPase subunit of ABC transporter with duplicated ATPase domains
MMQYICPVIPSRNLFYLLLNSPTHQYINHVHQDQEATATEVVTRKVRKTDPSISDEKARSALGALGLIGEKAIRKVGHLSGTTFAFDLY